MSYIGFEGDYVALEPEVRDAMLDLAIGGLPPGSVHLELGSGNGQFVTQALLRGMDSTGYEINVDRYNTSESQSNIILGDVLTNDLKANDIRRTDLITFWFTEPTGVYELMVKLYKGMSTGARLVFLYNSLRQFRDGVEQVIPHNWNIENVFWEPTAEQTVLGNTFYLFVR